MGTAKQLQSTIQQTLAGTLAWTAPEMLREHPTSKKCDVYSYAIILWELVSFELPFQGVAELMIPARVINGEVCDLTFIYLVHFSLKISASCYSKWV